MNSAAALRPSRLFLALVFSGLALAAPAVQTATTRANFDRPPYVDGKLKAPVGKAAHLPVAFRSEPGSIDKAPARSPVLAALLDSLRVELDALGLTTPLPVDPGLVGRPDVRFGARRGGVTPDGTPRAPGEIDTSSPPRMEFEVEGGSKAWREAVRSAAGSSGVNAVVSIQLGFDDYWLRQKNLKGEKAIELGVGRAQPVAWLTSLDDPVQVLQLTGALVAPDGRVLRVAAEGMIARRSGMTASMLGAQEVLTEEDLRSLAGAGTGTGTPAWRTALRALILGLIEDRKSGP